MPRNALGRARIAHSDPESPASRPCTTTSVSARFTVPQHPPHIPPPSLSPIQFRSSVRQQRYRFVERSRISHELASRGSSR